MLVTIEIPQTDRAKLAVAIQPLNIQSKGEKKLGDVSYVTLSARSPQDFFKLGRLMEKVTGKELDEVPAETAPKSATNKAK